MSKVTVQEAINDILPESKIIKAFFTSIKVEAESLRSIFKEMGDVMKETTDSKAFMMHYENGLLTISTEGNLSYQGQIPAICDSTEIFENNYVYKDIHDFLPEEGTVTVLLSSETLRINSQSDFAVLHSSVAYISPPIKYSELGNTFNKTSLLIALKGLLSMPSLAKDFSKWYAIALAEGKCMLKFPSIWIETDGGGLTTTLDPGTARVLFSYLNGKEEVFITDTPQKVLFRKQHSQLGLIKQPVTSLTGIDDVFKGGQTIGTFSAKELNDKVQTMYKALGRGDVDFYILRNFARLVARVENNLEITRDLGQKSDKDAVPVKFTMRIEYLRDILHSLSGEVEVQKKGDLICMKGAWARILIHSIG